MIIMTEESEKLEKRTRLGMKQPSYKKGKEGERDFVTRRMAVMMTMTLDTG